jgi:hypothetical protein
VAKNKIQSEDLPSPIPGDDEIRMLDEIAENCIPNRSEILSFHSDRLGRTVTVSRDDVYKMAAVMSSNNQIANVLGLDNDTISKNFKREVSMARAFARQRLITRFYHLAMNNSNPAYVIFALKNWANMSDTGLTEDLSEMEEGVEFKIRRPTKPIETLSALESNAKQNESD